MKPLIVCYSYTGHTREAALRLQSLTGGDLCQIFPRQPYPVSFPQLLEQARREIAAGVRPRLLVMGPGPQPYRTIFVGSPNWCGTIAPPLASWLSHYDFSGKVLFPFYSHCGGVRGDLREVEAQVNYLGVCETQGQFAALVSFAFNLGIGNLRRSTLLKKIRHRAPTEQVQAEFRRWNKAGGKVLEGLVRRREWEARRWAE